MDIFTWLLICFVLIGTIIGTVLGIKEAQKERDILIKTSLITLGMCFGLFAGLIWFVVIPLIVVFFIIYTIVAYVDHKK